MIIKRLTYFGRAATHACDGQCDKAWGINSRPTVPSRQDCAAADPDDYAFLSDGELGKAPKNPGTYEGGEGKPVGARGPDDINKWCVRECERAWMSSPGNPDEVPNLPDFSARFHNKAPHRREGVSREARLQDLLQQFLASPRPDQMQTLVKALDEDDRARLEKFLAACSAKDDVP